MSLENRLTRAIKRNASSEIEYIFEEIFNEYYKLVGFVMFKYIKEKEDVEDLVLEVFNKFYAECFKTEIKSIKAFLVVMAKNRAIDFLRQKHINLEYNDDIILDISDNHFQNDYYDIIDEMKKYLDDEEINIILLHSVEDYSFGEIGKMLEMPENSAKTKYHRAIKKFRRLRTHEI